jgi:hypothetical protein
VECVKNETLNLHIQMCDNNVVSICNTILVNISIFYEKIIQLIKMYILDLTFVYKRYEK